MTMNCQQCQSRIELLLDSALSETEQSAVEHHLDACPDCRASLQQERAMREELAALEVPPMRPGFPAEALAQVRRVHAPERRQGFIAGFGSAVAAGLALWFAVLFIAPPQERDEALYSVSVSVGRVEHVNLVLNSPQQMEQASITLSLPEHAELDGYPGQRELTWTASLHKGKNRLSLPLRLVSAEPGEIVARIRSAEGEKAFRLKLQVKARQSAVTHFSQV